MKPIWKHIAASFFALAIIAYMVFGLWMSRHTLPSPVCEHLYVRVLDADQRQYVSASELTQLVHQHNLYPVGKTKHCIALQPIENLICEHSMVRQAECYKTIQGAVIISLTQRQPVVRVLTEAETYFVDSDHKIMPVRPSVTTPMLMATGHVSRRMAQQELSEFALWLQQDSYWCDRIARVEVINPHMVHLIQANGQASIILGDWKDYERKLTKLRHWYEKGKDLNLEQYQQVDLRFHNQVIGLKSN